MDSTTAAISPTQHRVLEAMKRSGEATADELAQVLEISTSAVRQHLNALRSGGYIAARKERGQPGRPADHFHTTELTEPIFAKATNNLSIELLSHIEEEDPELITRIFERRRKRRVANARDKLVGKALSERVAILADLLDTEGYLVDFDEHAPGHFRINLHSCALWPVATKYGQACTTELEFLRELIPEAEIERVTHKTAGAHTCAYEIST